MSCSRMLQKPISVKSDLRKWKRKDVSWNKFSYNNQSQGLQDLIRI